MKVILLENQIELILKSLQNYSKVDPEKMQLIYATYESLLSQKLDISSNVKCNTNVIKKYQKTIYK